MLLDTDFRCSRASSVIDLDVTSLSEMKGIADLLVCLRIDDWCITCNVVMVLKACDDHLERLKVCIELCHGISKSLMCLPCRDLDLCTVSKSQDYIVFIRCVDVVEESVTGSTVATCSTVITLGLAKLCPCLTLIV